MSMFRVFAAAAAIVAGFGFSDVQAQAVNVGLTPAEWPPSSYTGRQYVDSEGCAFVRAEVDGQRTWVPRVTRSRVPVCGLPPSHARRAPEVAVEAASVTVVVVPKQPARVGKTPVRAARVSRQPKRFVPAHVARDQQASLIGISIPKGYKSAWDDDRLNPRRAHQTLAGKAQMDRLWTQTLPRRLISRDK